MKVRIVEENLTEKEAYDREKTLIRYYVFTLGYGIDIHGFNNKKDEPGRLTNRTFGGDGSYGMVHSEEWRKQHSLDMMGENNPMYGANLWNTYSDEKAQLVKEKIGLTSKGKNNPYVRG